MRVTPEIKAQMRAMRERGKSYQQIANYFKCSHTTVRVHTNDKYKETYNKHNLARYHRTKDIPEVKAKRKTYRYERYLTTGK